MPVDIEEFETPESPDFQRANGAPMVMVDGKRERYSRPSGFAKPLDDESALTNWRIDTACFGVAGDKALQAAYVSTKREDRKAIHELREKAIQAGRGNDAAAIGTAIHAMSERWEDPDDGFDPPEPYLSALKAYSAEMERLHLESVLFECAFVNTEYRAAGTADRVYRLKSPLVAPSGEILEAGTLVIGDLKTSKTLAYSMGAFACQMSLYAQGQLYDVVRDEFLDTPELNQDWGIIAWVPSNQEQGHCEMIWIDLQAGNEAAWLARMVKDHRAKWRKEEAIQVPDPLDAVVVALERELGASPVDLAEFIAFRIKQIREIPEAKALMLEHWPDGVPKRKADLVEEDHIKSVLELLDNVEAELGLTFPAGDPRSVINQGAK